MEATTKRFRKRDAILSCLRSTKQHPSAETLYQMLRQEHPDISLATVYRNLTYFKEQGIAMSLGTVNGTERFDANVEPHVHFICSCCESVMDLQSVQPTLNPQEDACKELGCRVDSYQLMFTGVCPQCLSQIKKTN